MIRKTHKINASGKILGRLASEIAILLQGKHKKEFTPYLDLGDNVEVRDVSKIKLSGDKLKQKAYYHHSGYPGGLKKERLEVLFTSRPAEVLQRAVYGMLPKNKLRNKRILRLKIYAR